MDSKPITKPSLVNKLEDGFWYVGVKTLDALARGVFYVVPGLIMAGCLVLLYQVVFWLKHGTWEPITVFDAVFEVLPAPFKSWLLHPTNWLGLWKLVGYVFQPACKFFCSRPPSIQPFPNAPPCGLSVPLLQYATLRGPDGLLDSRQFLNRLLSA
jgi:hypothetical protein